MDGFFGGGGGVKNETRDLARGSLHLTTFYNMFFVMSYFWLGVGLNVTYNFVTPVVMVCCILKA